MPALVNYAKGGRGRNNLPPAVVLPEPSVNEAGKVRPGQYAGRLGPRWEAWHLRMATRCPLGNGACPHCFRFEGTPFRHEPATVFETPTLTLPDGGSDRLQGRVGLLNKIERQQRVLEAGCRGRAAGQAPAAGARRAQRPADEGGVRGREGRMSSFLKPAASG